MLRHSFIAIIFLISVPLRKDHGFSSSVAFMNCPNFSTGILRLLLMFFVNNIVYKSVADLLNNESIEGFGMDKTRELYSM